MLVASTPTADNKPMYSSIVSTENCKPSILETVNTGLETEGVSLPEKLKLLSVALVLQPYDPFARTTTRSIADRLSTTESTLYRHIEKPALGSLCRMGVYALLHEHQAPRLFSLRAKAADLALQKELSFEEKVTTWSTEYAKLANPGSVYQSPHTFSNHGQHMRSEYEWTMEKSIEVMAKPEQITMTPGAPTQLLPYFGAMDMTEGAKFDATFVSQSVLNRIQA
jgi:hypothetical protein